MNLLKRKILLLLFAFFFLSGSLSSGMELEELEWKVSVGDSLTYKLTQYFDKEDTDGDGNINTNLFEITDENGHLVNITWQIGSKIKDTITQLNDSGAWLKRTYDGKITSEERKYALSVQKTTDNLTYWEEHTQSLITPFRNASADGDLVIVEEEIAIGNNTLQNIFKFNWKTGWIIYRSQKFYNASMIIAEVVMSEFSTSVPSLEFPIVISSCIVLIIYVRKSQFNKKT